jgi:hypothetical protein
VSPVYILLWAHAAFFASSWDVCRYDVGLTLADRDIQRFSSFFAGVVPMRVEFPPSTRPRESLHLVARELDEIATHCSFPRDLAVRHPESRGRARRGWTAEDWTIRFSAGEAPGPTQPPGEPSLGVAIREASPYVEWLVHGGAPVIHSVEEVRDEFEAFFSSSLTALRS